MGSYKNWFDKTAVAKYSIGKHFIIVTPEGENGWYTDIPAKPNTNYETYIVKELIPEIDGKYRTLGDGKHRVIGGLSMGGYGTFDARLAWWYKGCLEFSIVGQNLWDNQHPEFGAAATRQEIPRSVFGKIALWF